MREVLDEGKYAVVFEETTGVLYAERHGERWREFVGDKLVLSMLQEIHRLRGELRALTWYFTFCGDHVHPKTGAPLKNKFVRIGGTASSTRLEMIRRFGKKWGFQYPGDEGASMVVKYELTELVEDEDR